MRQTNFNKIFSKFPVVYLGNVTLRSLSLQDAEEYYNLFADKAVSEHLSDENIPDSVAAALEDVRSWASLFYRKQGFFWAIADSSNNKLIGTIGYMGWNVYNGRAEVSYDLKSEYWRCGIMTKALTNVLAFGFKEMKLNRIEARTMVDNLPSANLLLKVNFKKEGILRSYRVINNKPEDIALFSLIRAEANCVA